MHSIRQEDCMCDCIFITPPHGQPHATFRRNSGSDVGGFVNKHTVQVCCTCISAVALSLVALWSSSFSSAFQNCPQTSSLMALMKLVVCTRSSSGPQSFSTTSLLWASAVCASFGPMLSFLWASAVCAFFGPVLCPYFLWASDVSVLPLGQCFLWTSAVSMLPLGRCCSFGPVVRLGQYFVHASFGPVLWLCFLWASAVSVFPLGQCCVRASFGPVLFLWDSTVSVFPCVGVRAAEHALEFVGLTVCMYLSNYGGGFVQKYCMLSSSADDNIAAGDLVIKSVMYVFCSDGIPGVL